MMTDINKNKGFVVALACALLAMLVLLVAWRVMAKATTERAEQCRMVVSQYEKVAAKHQGEPNEKIAGLYKQKLEEAGIYAVQMRSAVAEEPAPKLSPNDLKEQVRKTIDDIVPVFREKNIPVPEDLGFTTIYQDKALPPESEMPRLISQYVIIRDVLAVLLAEPIVKIDGIERNPGEAAIADGGPSEPEDVDVRRKKKKSASGDVRDMPVFETVPVVFKFTTTPDTLYRISATIRNKSRFYRIRALKTTMEPMAKGEGKDPSDMREDMAVDMVVERIVLPHETPQDDAGKPGDK